MTANTASAFRRAGKKTLIPALLFALSIVLTVFVTWQTAQSCLDGDASSELVLAHHLNETGRILSSDWYYSSELRVLNTQLVFAPLFSLFSDWTMVRFTGALILQATLVLSFFYLCRQAKLSWGARFLGGALLLLPVSAAYGRFVLYHSYYMPHITISFFIVSLFLSALRYVNETRWLHAFIRFTLLCGLSLGSGLGGVRQGVVTHIPLLFLLIVFLFQDAGRMSVSEALRAHGKSLALICAALLAFLLGYIINVRYLSSWFVFSSYNDLTLNLLDSLKLPDILYGLLHAFGFRENLRILSVLGILSVSAVFSFGFFLVRSALFALLSQQISSACRFIALFFAGALTVMLCVFLLVDSGWYYPLYLLPVLIWCVPMLCVLYDDMPERASQLGRADICLLLCVLFLSANGLANSAFFASCGKFFPQKYEGVGYEDMTLAQKLEKPVEFLMENGYELGYSQFWSSNPVTEISDGKIKMINLLVHQYNRPLIVHEFLMLRSTYDMQTDKVFLLLPAFYNKAYVEMDIPDKGELVYDDGEFFIYHFDDPSVLREYTRW